MGNNNNNSSTEEGRGRLVANQDEIIKLEVDVGTDIIEVDLGSRPRGFNVRDI